MLVMSENPRRRKALLMRVGVLITIALLLYFLLQKCGSKPTAGPELPAVTETSTSAAPAAPQPADAAPAERLGEATISAPAQVVAGATFVAKWSGPGNAGDYVALARSESPVESYLSYAVVGQEPELELSAPSEAGSCELRYITAHSRSVLGRAPIEIVAASATVAGPAEVVMGSSFPVQWTGPNNPGDYITVVAKTATDAQHGHYAMTSEGSPLQITAPSDAGEAEIRYITGQGHKVLARRSLQIREAAVSLSAPESAIAGSTIQILWQGPNNSGDYITVVLPQASDSQYGNYSNTEAGSPLELLMPIVEGQAELRYVLGQGRKVLARRSIEIVPAVITLEAAESCKTEAQVTVTWTGPNYAGDYLTIVPKGAPEGSYGDYANTAQNSPLALKAPKAAGECEIRYVSAQGAKVLARRTILVQP